MKEFLILFKHELKMQFPLIGFKRNKKNDIFGMLLSAALIIGMASLFVMLVSTIAEGYVLVKINKILNPRQRAVELLNILYCLIAIVLVVGCIRKMVSTLTSKQNKQVYLRLPIKHQTIFMAKLMAILVWNFVVSSALVLPINIIFYITLNPGFVFWIKTLIVLIGLPIVVMGISTILLIPAIKIVEILKSRYLLLFTTITSLLIGLFVLYAKFLKVLQKLFETGSIKFLFNADFVSTLQGFNKFTYPINSFANIMLGKDVVISLLLIMLAVVLSGAIAYLVSSKLFNLTMYKNKHEFAVKRPRREYKTSKPIVALIKKEFKCVYRTPKMLFSYFSIAFAMPAMVYCCYTLFDSLIVNAFGIKVSFALALLVLLMFSVLTNTFCATNITREGKSFLKMKSIAINPRYILLSKVLFCAIVSLISVVISGAILAAVTNLKVWECAVCIVVVTLFALAQILIATRLDLNHAKLNATQSEAEASNSKTITKIISLGLIFSLLVGVGSIMIYILAQANALEIVHRLNLKVAYAYVLPLVISCVYLAISVFYYKHNINKSFDKLDK